MTLPVEAVQALSPAADASTAIASSGVIFGGGWATDATVAGQQRRGSATLIGTDAGALPIQRLCRSQSCWPALPVTPPTQRSQSAGASKA